MALTLVGVRVESLQLLKESEVPFSVLNPFIHVVTHAFIYTANLKRAVSKG
jgi:hypothetical protein